MNTKKSARKTKKSTRKVTGHNRILKDAKDILVEVRDDIGDDAYKTKNKLNEKLAISIFPTL